MEKQEWVEVLGFSGQPAWDKKIWISNKGPQVLRQGLGVGSFTLEKATGQYIETGWVSEIFYLSFRWPELSQGHQTAKYQMDFTKGLDFLMRETYYIHSHLQSSPCATVAAASCHCLGTAAGIAVATAAATAAAGVASWSRDTLLGAAMQDLRGIRKLCSCWLRSLFGSLPLALYICLSNQQNWQKHSERHIVKATRGGHHISLTKNRSGKSSVISYRS